MTNYSLHTICFFRQDDGDAGDDDVSSDDNTDILSSLKYKRVYFYFGVQKKLITY
jgi:hypothetical protein